MDALVEVVPVEILASDPVLRAGVESALRGREGLTTGQNGTPCVGVPFTCPSTPDPYFFDRSIHAPRSSRACMYTMPPGPNPMIERPAGT